MKLNGKKYQELIEQIKTETALDAKLDFLATMVFMIAVNDLQSIDDCLATNKKEREADIQNLNKKVNQLLVAVLGVMGILLTSHPALFKDLFEIIKKIF